MRFKLEEITVFFPYEYIYPEQYKYMMELKRTLDAGGHCLLEMPTGTGKTIALLSLITSYQMEHPEMGKLVYCTRTVPEMEKVLAELQNLIGRRQAEFTDRNSQILALGLSSRKNMCVHPSVSEEGSRESVDAKCRKLTAHWVRLKAQEDEANEIELCDFFEQYDKAGTDAVLQPGVYTLHDLRNYSKKKGWCPYFVARHAIQYANIIVYNYQYMIDPKVSQLVSKELERECVIVFDEAHNIDNICIEALSVHLRRQTLDSASRNLARLNLQIERMKKQDEQRLKDEYRKLVEGLELTGAGAGSQAGEDWLANPVLPEDVLKETVPGNIRRAEHFLGFMRRLIEFVRDKLNKTRAAQQESPMSFLHGLQTAAGVDGKSLRFCYDRLLSLMKTLEIVDTDDFNSIKLVSDFATLIGTYSKGFTLITEPYDERLPHIPDPVVQLCCLDASLAMKPVFSKFRNVIITSGTLSPIELYPKILDFNPVVLQSFHISLPRDCLCPVIMTKGGDQMPVSTSFKTRQDSAVIRNYGRLLVELSEVVPDGMVVFFVSYRYMDQVVAQWHDMGILADLMRNKLVFIETQDVIETTLALDNFRKACDRGRGGVFLSVARGKVSEGVDFDRHYGRCAIIFGVPYQYTLSKVLLARLEYLREAFHIREDDYLTFDAVRQAAQCVGRVIRSKADYGMMIFADKRYQKVDKRQKIPGWITDHMKDSHMSLSTDMVVALASQFFREMAQPLDQIAINESLLSQTQLDALATAEMEVQ